MPTTDYEQLAASKTHEFMIQVATLGINMQTMATLMSAGITLPKLQEIKMKCHENLDRMKKIIDELVDIAIDESRNKKT
jgi:hypothetical protein